MASQLRVRRPNDGFTLVEVVIAALLLSIGITALFSVCVSVRFKVNKDVYSGQMDFYARQLLEDLKSYVTADITILDGAPGNSGSWCHPKDSGCPGGWALAEGDHDVTGMLPASLSNAPVNAKLFYNVKLQTSPPVRRVDVTMTWDTPD